MPASIVEQFQLPARKLPTACNQNDAFIAISDGPSSQEYDLAKLQNCAAKVFCYGRVARNAPPDYYALADAGFAEVLEHLPPTRVLIPRDGPYGGPNGGLLWERLPRDRGHEYIWAPDDCAHHPVLNCLKLGAKSIFLLGYDGYYRNNGQLESASHAEQLHDTSIISREKYASRAGSTQQANFWISDINRISWDLTIKATHRVQRISPPIYNLSLGSRHRPIWDVHPEVLQQPFGRIDRRGKAMLVHVLETDDEIPKVGMQPTVSRARWGPLHVSNHADFINHLRAIEPDMAIYVRTHTYVAELAGLLQDDIQVGGLDTQLERQLHSGVNHFRLPPINDCWKIS